MGERSKHVWLGVCGLVIADEAVVREVKEETGSETEVTWLFGLRTGVIKNHISDNMLMFLLKPTSNAIYVQCSGEELSEAFLWMRGISRKTQIVPFS